MHVHARERERECEEVVSFADGVARCEPAGAYGIIHYIRRYKRSGEMVVLDK